MLLLLLPVCLAADPATLDELVAQALERDPEGRALALDAQASSWRATAAARPMDPQLMVGVEALGAMPDSGEETMYMVGATQMLRGPGEARAVRERALIDARRSEADRGRLAADLRLRFRQAAARIASLVAEGALLDEQVRSAEALRDIGLARYGAGARGPAGGAETGAGTEPGMGTRPPVVAPRSGGTSGMSGMSGMGGGSGARAPSAQMPMSSGGGMAGMSGGTSMPMGSEPPGFESLLRLDADIARAVADREATRARLEGEIRGLALFVGDDAARAVAAAPQAFLASGPEGESPEKELAAIDERAARADVDVARTAGRPDLMLEAAQRIMPEGMSGGTDLSVGVQVPLWGGRDRSLDAARASEQAATARVELVGRDLEVALNEARTALAAADARVQALEGVAVPRARAAWDVAQRSFATSQANAESVVRTWEALIAIEIEAVQARRERELRAAEVARLEGR